MIQVVYPHPYHQTAESRVFVMGRVTIPHATFTVNNQPVILSRQGFFSHLVDLEPGETVILLVARDKKNSEHCHSLSVIQIPPKAILSPDALAFDLETLTPATPWVLTPGDVLPVACLATPDCQVSVMIPGVLSEPVILNPVPQEGPTAPWIDNREMVFAQLHQVAPKIPMAGYYQGTLQVPLQAQAIEDASLLWCVQRLGVSIQGDALFCHEIPEAVSIWPGPRPAQLIGERPVVVRTGPSPQSARLTPLLPSTLVAVNGRQGDWYRICLRANQMGWLEASSLDWHVSGLDALSPLLIQKASSTQLVDAKFELDVVFKPSLNTASLMPCPMCIHPTEAGLEVNFFPARSQCDFIHQTSGTDHPLAAITWQQVETDEVAFQLAIPKLSGYDVTWLTGPEQSQPTLRLSAKILPSRWQEVSVLLDPGHGGKELGSVGLDGVPEKDRNLAIALALKAALNRQGLSRVWLTREVDCLVSLDERVDAVVAYQPDIVLSLHHNALPDGRDPAEHQGLSCYYYQPYSRALAAYLQAHLPVKLGLNDYGLFYDSLVMTRIPQAMAVLVEFGFFTHPQDYEKLCEPGFPKTAAIHLAKALRDFHQGFVVS